MIPDGRSCTISVSFRTKLSCQELRDLILDVQRHVELVGATERSHSRYVIGCTVPNTSSAHHALIPVVHQIRFMSSLPPTPETTVHVLAQGGAFHMPAFELQHNRRRVHAKEPAQADTSDSMIIQDGRSPATAIDTTSSKPRVIGLSSHDQRPSHKSPTPSSLPSSHSDARHPSADVPQRETALLSSLGSDPGLCLYLLKYKPTSLDLTLRTRSRPH
ncbi:hypothetical protein J3A83DRAFT_1629760 [Scleroderma citrinum]